VLHTTAGSFDAAGSWFERADSGVSAHYLIGLDGRLAQFVDEHDTARHAGRVRDPTAAIASSAGAGGVNPFTIGIEFEDGGDPLDVTRPDVQYETGGLLIAEVAARWRIPLDREHVVGHREVFAAKDCPGNLDLDRLVARARELSPSLGGPLIACLLPVRDGAAEIPGYLESVAAIGGVIVALDDGSNDETPQLLEASPLVAKLIRNPPRPDYAGWDDGENRRRLLAAAAELDPEWILFLDADERLDGGDAAALREFLERDGLAGVAYGLELYREWEGRVVAEPTHVFRLFAHDRAHELRAGRLHANPVPTEIPRSAWLRTTIRARHLDSPERLERRRLKYRQADPGSDQAGATAALLEPPAGPLSAWKPRPPGQPVLVPGPALPLRAGGPEPPAAGPELVCLLPARNCAADLGDYLACAEGFADLVVALDDGSTDDTGAILERAPLVERLLRNPVRATYAGWDDAANRQRLLDAAIELGARWALFLDADERLDDGDAKALRRLIEREADPGSAYGFRVHRMLDDGAAYDRADLWAYRLFAPMPGQRLPDRTLHLVPVPSSIPRSHWHRTTIRIQHLAGATEARRLARLRKYEEADPDLRWQSDYAAAILAPGTPRPWRPRPPDLPLLADPARSGVTLDLEELDPEAPLLSAIVIARDDEATIERVVRAVVEQECPVRFEVIVVVSGSPATAATVRRAFRDRVQLVELPEPALPGKARNAGLAVARGEYASFPGSHVELAPGSLARRFEAHERGWAMITGSIHNGNPTAAGWASYFLDHSSALPGRPSAELAGAPAHCSYVREFLLEIGGFREDLRAGEDTVANQELWRRGHRAYREATIELTHRSPCSTRVALVRHHFLRGRALGRILRGDFDRAARGGIPSRLRFLARYPRRRLESTDLRVERWGGSLRAEYRRVRRLVALGVAAAWAGSLYELVRPRRRAGAAQRRPDRPRALS
jgi:glycosyltransferase involved in cell wall biosynthesis